MKLSIHQFRSRPKKFSPYFPSAYCVDYLASDLCVKKYGFKVDFTAYAYTEEDLYALVSSKKDFEKFGRIMVKKFSNNPDYLKKLIKWSEKQRYTFIDFLKKNFPQSKIKKLSNKEIAERYKRYALLYRMFHVKNTPPWWCGTYQAEKELREYLAERKIANQDEVFLIIIESLEYQSENFQEEMSLLDIINKIREEKINKIKSLNNLPFLINKELEKHIEEFSSIPFGYNTGVIWDEKHYLKKINEFLAGGEDPVKLKNNIIAGLKRKKAKQASAVKLLKLPKKIYNLALALRRLAYLQELKKATQTKSHPYLQNIVYPEIARRLKLPAKTISYLSHNEIGKMLAENKIDKKIMAEVEERRKYSVFIMKDLKYIFLYGEKAKRFFKESGLIIETQAVKDITGTAASKGSAQGIVKVCKFSTEISKVGKGDVLVTAMTTPDFIPAIKKAAAVITDEGGITCHAAIISRELGIPCIIGTKIATKVLKDGDLVEVDAEKGIVKILKKNQT